MNEISTGIYVGDHENAENKSSLDSQGITHVLSLELEDFDIDAKFHHKFVKIYDEPQRDLLGNLGECFTFIEEGLVDGKVLIHCSMGVSRSSSVAVAFLMYRDKITRDKALHILKETRPYACPNEGFMEQLSLFEAMGCQLDTSNQQYRHHRLEQLSYQMKDGRGQVPDELMATDPQLSDTQNLQTIYKCRKCRRAVFLDSSVLDHARGKGQTSFAWHKQASTVSSAGAAPGSCTSIFIEPVSWMEAVSIGEPSGKLSCPKCDAKLGSFNWAGQQCSCGRWVTPGFQIHQNRVDKSVHRLPPQPAK